ncbi:MAG: FliM/FliN family flagellar motor switch protein [Myxococcales bacterium]|nr:FliM/FliN family flagellar motor switch protein [Myxococcales bacterium]
MRDVPVELVVELARVTLPLGELSQFLVPGGVIPLEQIPGARLDVRVQSRLVARGEAIAIGDRCGVRILELVKGGK